MNPAPLGMLGDDRLARLVGAGNERAFATLYARFHQPLYRYCHSMLRHEADAQDALQSTFASALVALRRGQIDAPVRPWLFRIAHNESISLLRRRRPASELSDTMASPTMSVEATADERARLAQLVADLQELPDRQRGALVMRELNGLSHEELAQALGISVGAAKQTVFEARRALAEFEEGRAMACEQIQRVISDGDRRALRARRVRAHLRECHGCTAFAEAIPERRSALMALSPVLPAATAAGLFTRITGAASSAHHGGGGLLAGAASKGVGAAVSTKALVTGVAIVATAAAGTAGIVKVVTSSGHSPAPAVAHRHASHGGASGSAASDAGRLGGSLSAAGRSNGHRSVAPGKSDHGRGPTHPGGRATTSSSTGTSHSSSSTGRPATTSGQGNSQSNPSATNPNAHGGNPNAGGGNAGSGSSNPNAHGGNPNAHGGNSNSQGGSSNAGGSNPNAHGGNPNAHGGNPNAHGGNPNAGGGNPNAHGGNPNAGGGNPNAGGGNANAHGGNPNAHGGNPNAHGGNPTAGGGNPNAHGGNPNAGGSNSHGKGHA